MLLLRRCWCCWCLCCCCCLLCCLCYVEIRVRLFYVDLLIWSWELYKHKICVLLRTIYVYIYEVCIFPSSASRRVLARLTTVVYYLSKTIYNMYVLFRREGKGEGGLDALSGLRGAARERGGGKLSLACFFAFLRASRRGMRPSDAADSFHRQVCKEVRATRVGAVVTVERGRVSRCCPSCEVCDAFVHPVFSAAHMCTTSSCFG